MKKILSLLLLVSITLCFLVGCNGIGGFYRVTVTGDQDTLMQPIKPTYRAGTVIEIKSHTVFDGTLHVFVNDEEIPMNHFDSDYWSYEFVMPEENITIHLTFDRFYGREEYEFEELCYGLKYLENEITKVSIITQNFSERYTLIETRYSFKQEDIDNFKAIVNQKLIKADKEVASQAKYGYKYTFYYNSEHNGERSEELTFNDKFFTWNDFSSWQAFKFEDENYVLPTIENPDLVTYSFRSDGRSNDVKKYDDESFSMEYFSIGAVDFIPYEGEHLETDSTFYLDSRYGKINLLSPTVFELNGEYYEVISRVDDWAYNYCHLANK